MRTLVGLVLICSFITVNYTPTPKPPKPEFTIQKAIEKGSHLGVYRFVNPTSKLWGCLVRGDGYNLAIIIKPMTLTKWYYKPSSMKHRCMEIPDKFK